MVFAFLDACPTINVIPFNAKAANATDVPNFKEIYSYEDMLYDYKLG